MALILCSVNSAGPDLKDTSRTVLVIAMKLGGSILFAPHMLMGISAKTSRWTVIILVAPKLVSRATQIACPRCNYRVCKQSGIGTAAYPQEFESDEFRLLCMNATWCGEVEYPDLSNCAGQTQSSLCYSSTHDYCDPIGYDGMVQASSRSNMTIGKSVV